MMSNSESRKRLAEAQRGDEAGDVEALRNLCLSHFRLTDYGWRYFPTDAANAILASDWLAARDAEQRRLGAEAVVDRMNTLADEFDTKGRRGSAHFGADVGDTIRLWIDRDPRPPAARAAARAAAQQVSER